MTILSNCDWLAATPENYPTMRSAVFVTADDFLRLSMQAYYAAVKDMAPPAGERWLHGGDDPSIALPYSSAEDLHKGLLHHLGERLCQHANRTGHFIDRTSRRTWGARLAANLSPRREPEPA